MRFLRYPGSKRKYFQLIKKYLPDQKSISGKYIEPFVGGGAIFLEYAPSNAILNDVNSDLIDLYKGIRNYPRRVWEIFSDFPTGSRSYYLVRDLPYKDKHLSYRAARVLFLNRTCFKGMWRHGADGKFNVGYGGEERRWAINRENLLELSAIFKNAAITNYDYEKILKEAVKGDFVFLDPPYRPGEKELKDAHYSYGKFSYEDQEKLSRVLLNLTEKKVKWIMTNSDHPAIISLYEGYHIHKLRYGTSDRIGVRTNTPKEIIIKNY